ncbi:MAG: sigma-54 dependent transcriptional regulator [Candidatus Zixiibacteriota bacterium]
MMARILIIDDEENIRASLKSALDKRGHDVVTAADCQQGREYASASFDIIFLDIMLPDGSGLDVLETIVKRNPRQLVVMISGHADIDTAVKAIRLGAYDFIEKPLSLDKVFIAIDNAGKTRALLRDRDRLAGIVYGDLIGESPSINKIKEDIAKSAPKTNRFLILGENGTGKELVAHLIHRSGKSGDGPFVAVNCAALPRELVESELFGHTQGAFTGAKQSRRGKFLEANGGTIFLDEIGDMPLEAQAKILRVIEARELTAVGSDKTVAVNCAIVAASNRDLTGMIEEGKFREDLYYRLNVVTIHLPPLRDRKQDIPLLVDYFLSRFAAESGSEPKRLSREAMSFLKELEFSGNIRELKNLMERINIYCEESRIELDMLRPLLPIGQRGKITSLKEAVDRFEEEYIRSALERNDGNVAETARQLGIERSHLYKKIRRIEGKE